MKQLTLEEKKERGWFYVGHDKYYWRNCNVCGKEYCGMGRGFCSKICSANLKLIEQEDGTVSIVLRERSTGHNYGQQISIAKKDKPAHPNSISAATKARLGSKLSEEQKKQISLRMSGSNHPNWKRDRTKLKKSEKKHLDAQYKAWSIGVKDRDLWICKLSSNDCSGRLEAHHIYNWIDFPEKRYRLENGITLCHAHHPRGRKNEERFIEVFESILDLKSELI